MTDAEFRYDCPLCHQTNVIRSSNVGHVVRCVHCKCRVAWDGESPVPGPPEDPPPPKRTNWSLIGSAALVIAISTPGLSTGVLDLRDAGASRSWDRVDCVVVASGVQVSDQHMPRTGTGVHIDDTARAGVRYRYAIEGKTYEGSTVRFGQVYSSSRLFGTAEETVKRHPIGPGIVFVDPHDPSRSVLEPGFTAAAFLKPIVSLIFFVLGLWLARAGLSGRR